MLYSVCVVVEFDSSQSYSQILTGLADFQELINYIFVQKEARKTTKQSHFLIDNDKDVA